MFSWASGEHLLAGIDGRSRLRPRDARALIDTDDAGVWSSGLHVRSVVGAARGVRATLIGTCAATDQQVRECLALARSERCRALAMLPGSFWTVLEAGDETVVFGDLAHRRRVYYALHQGRLVWATAATPLAARIGGLPRLDALGLEVVVRGVSVFGGGSPYDRVDAVPQGSLLRIAPSGYRVEPWYTPPAGDQAEAVAALTESLIGAIKARLSDTAGVTTDVAGLDSATVAAAVAAARHGVTGLTLFDGFAPDALEQVRRTARSIPGLRHEVVSIDEGHLPYAGLDDLDRLPVTDLPCSGAVLVSRDRLLLGRAAALGSQAHFTGRGGDLVLSGRPIGLGERLRAGRVLAAGSGALAVAREQRSSSTAALLALLRLPVGSHRRSVRRAARLLANRAGDPSTQPNWAERSLSRTSLTAAAGWLTPAAVELAIAQLLDLANVPPVHASAERAYDWREAADLSQRSAAFFEIAREEGIEVHNPYLDASVLDSCLALAGRLREPRRTFKPLVTVGLADLLPPPVAAISSKDGLFPDDGSALGLRRHADAVRALVDSSQLVHAGLFDKRRVGELLETMVVGGEGDFTALRTLVGIEVWLAHGLAAKADTWWEEL
jgi:asparagine synthase (glutamine-hydrolysing)